MRGLKRLPEPQILIDRKENWTNVFVASEKKRPDSSKYAHDHVKIQLNSMSFNKCFYCETKLKGSRKEVDHHIEVSLNKTLAYEWSNLYLCCDNCNNKIPHSHIPITEALDPCRDEDDVIKQHLTFVKELIEPADGSELGLTTIQKYRLDSELIDNRRLKQLNLFLEILVEIRTNQIAENRNTLLASELNIIHRFKSRDNSFSRMFEVIIEKYGL